MYFYKPLVTHCRVFSKLQYYCLLQFFFSLLYSLLPNLFTDIMSINSFLQVIIPLIVLCIYFKHWLSNKSKYLPLDEFISLPHLALWLFPTIYCYYVNLVDSKSEKLRLFVVEFGNKITIYLRNSLNSSINNYKIFNIEHTWLLLTYWHIQYYDC